MQLSRTGVSAVAVTAVAATLTALLAAPANADYAEASNLRTQTLTVWPTSANPPATVSRSINLVRGCYDWNDRFDGNSNHHSQELAAGAYTWTDTLVPNDNYTYSHFSELHTAGRPTARFTDVPRQVTSPTGYGYKTVQWGSSLYWIRPNC